jgi:hypothetical protein
VRSVVEESWFLMRPASRIALAGMAGQYETVTKLFDQTKIVVWATFELATSLEPSDGRARCG